MANISVAEVAAVARIGANGCDLARTLSAVRRSNKKRGLANFYIDSRKIALNDTFRVKR